MVRFSITARQAGEAARLVIFKVKKNPLKMTYLHGLSCLIKPCMRRSEKNRQFVV